MKGHHVKLSDFDFFNDTLIVNWLLLFVVTFYCIKYITKLDCLTVHSPLVIVAMEMASPGVPGLLTLSSVRNTWS